MKRNKAVGLSLLALAGLAVTQVTVQGGGNIATLALTTPSAGGVVTIQPSTGTATYNFNLPTGAGVSGGPLLSGGGGTTPMKFGTATTTNAATLFVTGASSFLAGNSGQGVTIDGNANAQASGFTNGGAINPCYNTTPVTQTTTGTGSLALMSCSIVAGLLNSLNRNLHVEASGVLAVPSTATKYTVEFKLGSTILCTQTLGINVSATLSNVPWKATCDAMVATVDTGSGAALETSELLLGPNTSATGNNLGYLTNSTTTVTQDLLLLHTLQINFYFFTGSGGSANSVTERMLRARAEN